MAEEEEVIVIEEPEDGIEKDIEATNAKEEAKSRNKKKKLLIILGVTGIVLIFMIVLLIVLLTKKDAQRAPDSGTQSLVKKIKSAESVNSTSTKSQIEKMIQKANILYAKGDKKEALGLYEQIATYSASISHYNLGVSQMHQRHYKMAINSFKKAIQNGENSSISALNTAICYLHLNDKKRFDYYLQMANADLPESFNSSLYSYLYALINYYKGNYYEILSAINHPTTTSYKSDQNHIAAVSYLVMNRPLKAIDMLERSDSSQDFLLLGESYARVGDYSLAARYLQKALNLGDTPIKSRKALALVQLKNGMPQRSAQLLKALKEDFKGKGVDLYPIKTKLSPSLYSIDDAQKHFSAKSMLTKKAVYRLLFEFAPFKIFNADQTINYIKKGSATIYVDKNRDADNYLSRSSSLSHVNLLISKAIKAAINHRLRKANTILLKAAKLYPSHSILQYDLGLTYAQMGNFTKAHTHFLRSYYLDASNYLSAIFSLLSEDFIGRHTPQIEHFIQDDLSRFTHPNTLQRFYSSLFYFYKGNLTGASKWLESDHENRPEFLLLDTIIASNMGNWPKAKEKVRVLRDIMPRDILANLLYMSVYYKNMPIKKFSAKANLYIKRHPCDMNTIYYGSAYARENYIRFRFITGTLYPFKKLLEHKLLVTTDDPSGIMEALGLSDIYLQHYEEAYTIFNQLIDKYKHQDSRTLFLGAVASIGAKHNANASALLELAKLSDPNNMQSRYGLGLLYLERGNTDAASIQFSKIPDGGFKSRFFDFDIIGLKKKI